MSVMTTLSDACPLAENRKAAFEIAQFQMQKLQYGEVIRKRPR